MDVHDQGKYLRDLDQEFPLKRKELWIRLSRNTLELWGVSQRERNRGWHRFKVIEIIRRQDDENDGEVYVITAIMVSFLNERDQTNEAQFFLKLGEAWEVENANSRHDHCISDRQLDPDHIHNTLDIPRIHLKEQFPEVIPRDIVEIVERIQHKNALRKSNSLSNVSTISDSPRIGVEVNIHKGFRRLNLDLEERNIIAENNILKAYLKKEENTVYRIFQYQTWLTDISNQAYRRLAISSYKEINIDLAILNRHWSALQEQSALMPDDPAMSIIIFRQANPAVQLALWFGRLIEIYNQKITELPEGQLLSERLKIFEDMEGEQGFEYDDSIGIDLVGTDIPSWARHGDDEEKSPTRKGIIREDLECSNTPGNILFHKGQLIEILQEDLNSEELKICSLDILREEAYVPTSSVNTNQEDFQKASHQSERVFLDMDDSETVMRTNTISLFKDHEIQSSTPKFPYGASSNSIDDIYRELGDEHLYEEVDVHSDNNMEIEDERQQRIVFGLSDALSFPPTALSFHPTALDTSVTYAWDRVNAEKENILEENKRRQYNRNETKARETMLQEVIDKQAMETLTLKREVAKQQAILERYGDHSMERRFDEEKTKRRRAEEDIEVTKRTITEEKDREISAMKTILGDWKREVETREEERKEAVKDKKHMEMKLKHEGLKNQRLGKDVETLQELMKESRSAVSRNNEEQKKSIKLFEEKRKELKDIGEEIKKFAKQRDRSKEREQDLENKLTAEREKVIEKEERIKHLTFKDTVEFQPPTKEIGERKKPDEGEFPPGRRSFDYDLQGIQMEEEAISSNFKFLYRRISKFEAEVSKEHDIAKVENISPTKESSRKYDDLRKRNEKFMESFENLEERICKLKVRCPLAGERTYKVTRIIQGSLDSIEEEMDGLKTYSYTIAHIGGDIQVFKLSSIHHLCLDKLIPGSSFHEWLQMARNLQKKHNIENSILLLKVFSSMERHCYSLMVSIKAKNPTSLDTIENLLYQPHGLPLTMLEHLNKFHQREGRVPYPINARNAGTIKLIAEKHVSAINSGICQLKYHIDKFGLADGIRKMEQGYLSNKSLYSLADMLPEIIVQEGLKLMGKMDAMEKLDYIKEHFENILEASQEYVSVFGTHAESPQESDSKGGSHERNSANNTGENWKRQDNRRRIPKVLFNQQQRQRPPISNQQRQAPGPSSTRQHPLEIGNVELFNSCLATQFNKASQGDYRPMVIQTSPGQLSFSSDLQHKVLGFTGQNKDRASVLMNLMGFKEGCPVCLTIMEEQKNQGNKVLLPHFKTGKTNKLWDRGITASCPMLLRLTEAKAHDLLLKQTSNCMKCGMILSQPGNLCSSKNCDRFGCQACRKAVVACTCSQDMKDLKTKLISTYEMMLRKYKTNISSINPSASQNVFIAGLLCEIMVDQEDTEYVLASKINTYLERPGVYRNKKQMMEAYKGIRSRKTGRHIFTIFSVRGTGGEMMNFVHDSGCSEFCVIKRLIGSQIPAAGKSSKKVETAGGEIVRKDSFKMLLPLAKEESEQYLEVEGVVLEKILNGLPISNIEKAVRKLYENYTSHCAKYNTMPEFSIEQLPTKVGGEIAGLMGDRVCTPRKIFSCPDTGLTVSHTAFSGADGNGALAISGLISPSNDDPEANLITNAEDTVLIMPAVLEQDEDSEAEDEDMETPNCIKPDELFIAARSIDREEVLEDVIDARKNIQDEDLRVPRQIIKDSNEAWRTTRCNLSAKKKEKELEELIQKQERKIWNKFMDINKTPPKINETNNSDLDVILAKLTIEEIEVNYGQDANTAIMAVPPLEKDFPKLQNSRRGNHPSVDKGSNESYKYSNDVRMKSESELRNILIENGITVKKGTKKKTIKCKKEESTSQLQSFLEDETENSELPCNIICLCGASHILEKDINGEYSMEIYPRSPLCTIILPRGYINTMGLHESIQHVKEIFLPKNFPGHKIKSCMLIEQGGGSETEPVASVIRNKDVHSSENKCVVDLNRDVNIGISHVDTSKYPVKCENNYPCAIQREVMSTIGEIESNIIMFHKESDEEEVEIGSQTDTAWSLRELRQLSASEKTFVEDTHTNLRRLEDHTNNGSSLDMDVIMNCQHSSSTSDYLQHIVQGKLLKGKNTTKEENILLWKSKKDRENPVLEKEVVNWFSAGRSGDSLLLKIYCQHPTIVDNRTADCHVDILIYSQGKLDQDYYGIIESLADNNSFDIIYTSENQETLPEIYEGSSTDFMGWIARSENQFLIRSKIENFSIDNDYSNLHLKIIKVRILGDRNMTFDINILMKEAALSCRGHLYKESYCERYLYPILDKTTESSYISSQSVRTGSGRSLTQRPDKIISCPLGGNIKREILRLRDEALKIDGKLTNKRSEVHITLGTFTKPEDQNMIELMEQFAREIRLCQYDHILVKMTKIEVWAPNIIVVTVDSPRLLDLNCRFQEIMEKHQIPFDQRFSPHITIFGHHEDMGWNLQKLGKMKLKKKQELITKFHLHSLKMFYTDPPELVLDMARVPMTWRSRGNTKQTNLETIHEAVLKNHLLPIKIPTLSNEEILLSRRSKTVMERCILNDRAKSMNYLPAMYDRPDLDPEEDQEEHIGTLAMRVADRTDLRMDVDTPNSPDGHTVVRVKANMPEDIENMEYETPETQDRTIGCNTRHKSALSSSSSGTNSDNDSSNLSINDSFNDTPAIRSGSSNSGNSCHVPQEKGTQSPGDSNDSVNNSVVNLKRPPTWTGKDFLNLLENKSAVGNVDITSGSLTNSAQSITSKVPESNNEDINTLNTALDANTNSKDEKTESLDINALEEPQSCKGEYIEDITSEDVLSFQPDPPVTQNFDIKKEESINVSCTACNGVAKNAVYLKCCLSLLCRSCAVKGLIKSKPACMTPECEERADLRSMIPAKDARQRVSMEEKNPTIKNEEVLCDSNDKAAGLYSNNESDEGFENKAEQSECYQNITEGSEAHIKSGDLVPITFHSDSDNPPVKMEIPLVIKQLKELNNDIKKIETVSKTLDINPMENNIPEIENKLRSSHDMERSLPKQRKDISPQGDCTRSEGSYLKPFIYCTAEEKKTYYPEFSEYDTNFIGDHDTVVDTARTGKQVSLLSYNRKESWLSDLYMLLEVDKDSQQIEDIIKGLLIPEFCPYQRCRTCLSCTECAPSTLFKIGGLRKAQKMQQNEEIYNAVAPIQLSNGTYKIIARYPIQEELAMKYLAGSNLREVALEYDRKIKRLNGEQKKLAQDEFSKLINLGFIMPFSSLPIGVQTEIDSQKIQYFISAAPSYKMSSRSTRCRVAINGSKRNKLGYSINDIMSTGKFEMDLQSSFRAFRLHNYPMINDLDKFFNSVFLSVHSFNTSQLVWREGCDLKNNLERYVMTRLTYGLRASTSICQVALLYICEFAEKSCTGTCQDGDIDCKEIQHEFSKMIRKIYVDDLVWSCSCREKSEELMVYAEDILGKFGFTAKCWIYRTHNKIAGSEGMLDGEDRTTVLGYLWNHKTDRIRVRTPIIHNGSKIRNYLVKNRDRHYIDETGVKRSIEPPELIVLDTDNGDKLTYENIVKTYQDIPHTLRFITSKTAAIFDHVGLLGPILGQLRYIVSTIVGRQGLIYDKEVSRSDYMHWIRAYYEALKCTKLEFRRQLKDCDLGQNTNLYGAILADYSDVANMVFYLIYETPNGNESVMVLSRSILLKVSVPRGELSAISMAAAARRTFMEELSGKISTITVFSDSKVALFWSNKTPATLDNFLSNRVKGIQACLDPKSDLWHVISSENSADIGSKFAGPNNLRRPFLTSEDIRPGSFFHNPGWITNIPEAVTTGKVTPMARIISDNNCNMLDDDDQRTYLDGFRGNKHSFIQDGLKENLVLPDATVQDGQIFGSCDSTIMLMNQHDLECKGNQTNECLFERSRILFYRSIMLIDNGEELPSGGRHSMNTIEPELDEDINEEYINDPTNIQREDLLEQVTTTYSDPIEEACFNIRIQDEIEGETDATNAILARQMFRKFHLRHQTTINNDHHGITGLTQVLPYETYMKKDFVTIVNKHRMLLLSCIKFLGLIKRTLSIERAHTPLVDSITFEADSLIRFARELQSSQSQKRRHAREIKVTPFINGITRLNTFKTIPGYSFNCKNAQLNTLTRSSNNCTSKGEMLFKNKFRLHPSTAKIVRDVSKLKNLLQQACNSKRGADRGFWIMRAWPIVIDLTTQTTYRYRATSILTNMVLQDITYLIHQSILCGCKDELQTASMRYRHYMGDRLRQAKMEYMSQGPSTEQKNEVEGAYAERWDLCEEDRKITEKRYAELVERISLKKDRLSEVMRIENQLAYPVDLSILSLGRLPSNTWHIQQLPRTQDCIESTSYSRCERATSVFLAMIATSEVLEHSSETKIKNHVVMKAGFALSKSRFTDYMQEGEEENLSLQLLQKAGFSQGNLVIDTFSSLSLPLFTQHHLKREVWLKRRTVDSTHFGRYRTVMEISKTKHILGVKTLVAALIKGCPPCDRRLKKYEKVPEGRIHSQGLLTNATNLVLYVDLAGPLMLRARPTGADTRANKANRQKFYVIVAVCATSRLVTMALIGSRKTNDVALGLRSIVSRTNFPYLLITDNEGALHTISKEGKIGISDGSYIREFGIPMYFVPPTERGHISNATCERRIRSLKDIIGNLNFERTGLDVAGVVNTLQIAEETLNSVPVGTRSFGKRHDITSMAPNTVFVAPNGFLGRLNTRRPIGLIRLDRNIDNSLHREMDIRRCITSMMGDYLMALQREAIRGFDVNPGTIISGDICAFKVNESQFHQALSPWRYGVVTKAHTSEIDGRARIITIRYTTLPGDSINKKLFEKPKHVTTQRRLDQVVKLSSSSHNHLAYQFYFDTELVEKLINKQFGGDTAASEETETEEQVTPNQDQEVIEARTRLTEPTPQIPNSNHGVTKRTRPVKPIVRERWILRDPGKPATQALTTLCQCCTPDCILAAIIMGSVASCTRLIPTTLVKMLYLITTLTALISGETGRGCEQFLLVSENKAVNGLYYRSHENVFFGNQDTLEELRFENETRARIGSVYTMGNDTEGKDPQGFKRVKDNEDTFIFITQKRIPDSLFHFSKTKNVREGPLNIKLDRWNANQKSDKIFCSDKAQSIFHGEHPRSYISQEPWEMEIEVLGSYPTIPNKTISVYKSEPSIPYDYGDDYVRDNEAMSLSQEKAGDPDQQTNVNQKSWKTGEIQGDDNHATDRNKETRKRTVNEGELTSIRCLDHTENVVNYKWRRHIKENQFVSLKSSSNTLIIGKASMEDSALYQCLAKTTLGELITISIYLYVRQTSVFTKEDYSSGEGDDEDKLFEAYNCDESKNSGLISVDLRAKINCNEADYKNYQEPTPMGLMIIQERSSHTFQALHCSLHIHTRHAYCGSGFLSLKKYSHSHGFRESVEEGIELTMRQCLDAYTSGKTTIQIGEQLIHVPTRRMSTGAYNINTYLSGSKLFKNGSCEGANSIRAYWSKDKPLDNPKGQIVNLIGKLKVQMVTALLDLKLGEALIPQHGLKFNSTKGTNPIQSSDQGIYLTMDDTMFHKYVSIYKGEAKSLKPKGQKLPEIVIFDVSALVGNNLQRIAFSLGELRIIDGTNCHETQYRNYFICRNSTSWTNFEAGNSQNLQDLSSGSVMLLSASIDNTVSGLIKQVCLTQDLLISRASRNFRRYGADLVYPEKRGKGVNTLALGEAGIIQTCDRKLVKAADQNGRCCKNLKVRLVGMFEERSKTYYLEPLSRKLVQDCNEVTCTDQLSITFFNTRNNPMCQRRDGLKSCSWTAHDQNHDFSHLMFRPLQILDYGTRHISAEEIRLIAGRTLAKEDTGLDFLKKVVENAKHCKGRSDCNRIESVNDFITAEIGYITNPYLQWEMKDWQIGLMLTITAWASWCIGIGILRCLFDFVRRMKNMSENNMINCCNVVIGLFTDLYSNMSPLYTPVPQKGEKLELEEDILQLRQRLHALDDFILDLRGIVFANRTRIRMLEADIAKSSGRSLPKGLGSYGNTWHRGATGPCEETRLSNSLDTTYDTPRSLSPPIRRARPGFNNMQSESHKANTIEKKESFNEQQSKNKDNSPEYIEMSFKDGPSDT